DAAHGLRNDVNTLLIVPAFQRHILQHVECFDDRHAARARRRSRQYLPGVAAASVLRAQDFADFRLVVRKVLERNDATVLGHFVREQMRSEEHTSELQSLPTISYAV